MKQQTFLPDTQFPVWNKRPITIKVGEHFITFHFKKEHDREFYSIPKYDWISDRKETRQGREDNWHNHMKEKVWFSGRMENFINSNT